LAQGTIKPFVNISWNGRHPIGFKYLFWRGPALPGSARPAPPLVFGVLMF